MSNFQNVQFSKDPIFKRSNFHKVKFFKSPIFKISIFKRSNLQRSNFHKVKFVKGSIFNPSPPIKHFYEEYGLPIPSFIQDFSWLGDLEEICLISYIPAPTYCLGRNSKSLI